MRQPPDPCFSNAKYIQGSLIQTRLEICIQGSLIQTRLEICKKSLDHPQLG